ncbi:hypothetical protein DL89DRAFT_265408 [Linderina pennispora]|uniref:Alpha/beta hydrolase fold-3 domain-containing protein n=1 Tax=Linderina pennispora TaxID=61395 RepID=A0A1Y1WIZ0_9FUNG|nr:uncharacterized protein DL89DRAFT_265408 [Linderina pennispora]ORX73298.1 hypothetical protein DL89DRAFT_265408 [Linderina pennispora]
MAVLTKIKHSISYFPLLADVGVALSAFSWLQLAQLCYVSTTVVIKSVYQYYRNGPRLPKWDLTIQLTVDLGSGLSKVVFPYQTNDDGIERIDFHKIVITVRRWGNKKLAWPKEKGTYRSHSINTQEVEIDISKLADIEIVGTKLTNLAQNDMALQDPRILECEIILRNAAIQMLESHATNADNLLDTVPVVKDEKIVLYFHGGGWILGNIETHRVITGEISQASGTRVVSVNYRLSPEYAFPAHLLDAYISYCFLLKQGFKPSNIVVAGDSAGGQLALSLTHLLRHIGAPVPAGLVLLSPATDQRHIKYEHDAPAALDYLMYMPVETPASMVRLMIAPGQPLSELMKRELESPLISPIYGSFSGFPSTLIQTGGCECFLDGNIALREKIKSQNPDVPDIVRQDVYDDMPHDFHLIFPYRREASKSYKVIGEFINNL